MGHVWKEKKTNMYLGSLLMHFDSIIGITKKAPSFESLNAYIMFDDSFGVGKTKTML